MSMEEKDEWMGQNNVLVPGAYTHMASWRGKVECVGSGRWNAPFGHPTAIIFLIICKNLAGGNLHVVDFLTS
jgi:hypothetical protein